MAARLKTGPAKDRPGWVTSTLGRGGPYPARRMTNGGPMQPTFDGPWRARALAGDPDAVRALTDCALPALYRFCLYRVGRDVHLCEEVVQETLVRALRDLPRYDPGRADNQIMPWLTGLARNAIQRALN